MKPTGVVQITKSQTIKNHDRKKVGLGISSFIDVVLAYFSFFNISGTAVSKSLNI